MTDWEVNELPNTYLFLKSNSDFSPLTGSKMSGYRASVSPMTNINLKLILVSYTHTIIVTGDISPYKMPPTEKSLPFALSELSLSTWQVPANNNSRDQKNREEEEKRITDLAHAVAYQVGHHVGADGLGWTEKVQEEEAEDETSSTSTLVNYEIREASLRNIIKRSVF